MSDSIVFTATGDSFITRRLPSLEDREFREIVALLSKADVRFNNLETTLHKGDVFPGPFSGGTWASSSPSVLNDIEAYGFNLINWANNHTLDYSYDGLSSTEKYLDQFGFVHAGAGENMAKASNPKYLDSTAGRIGFIAATSSFHESWIAGEQSRDMLGRPGINPLRIKSTHLVTKEQLEQLNAIAKVTDINADINLNIKEGFEVESEPGKLKFGKYSFEVGENPGLITEPDPRDLERIGNAISEATRQAEYVVVSIHSHEIKGEEKSNVPDFLQKFARFCIDCGANAVLGHGPHILRGIEIYKDSPIFYSLGNFIFQTDTVHKLPYDFYEKYGLGYDKNTADAFDTRSKNGKVGLGVNPYVWESAIPIWKMKDKKLTSLTLYPIELGFGQARYVRGWPALSDKKKIIENLAELSKPFGTTIEMDGPIGKVKL